MVGKDAIKAELRDIAEGRVSSYQGRLELTWTNKHPRLLAHDNGSYEWVPPSDYRVAEVRLLHDAGTVGEAHSKCDRAKDNLLIRGDALNALTSLIELPEFELGQTVATPGAIEAMEAAGHIPLDEFDREQNELALRHGSRLLSAYATRLDEKLWVMTEADRSATTRLLPAEY